MAKFEEVLAPGITIRESANDGSDFTNPTADYRRLFLGEDGLLHVKDSSGTVTDPYTGAGAVATDAIWDAAGDLAVGSGANTAARLAIGAVGGHLSRINGVVAWDSGTSFPGSKATGDRYYRSDLGLVAYWDGSQWVSETLYRLPLQCSDASLFTSLSASTNNIAKVGVPHKGTYGIYLVGYECVEQVNTTNNGTNFWTITPSWSPATPGTNAFTTFTTGSGPDTAGAFVIHTVALGSVLDSTAVNLKVDCAKTLSPGNLVMSSFAYTYRLILT